MNKKPLILVLLFVLLLVLFDPFHLKNLGSLTFKQQNTVTVVGEATTDVANKVATFDVGVTFTDVDKEKAVSGVNQSINKITVDLKSFGIPPADLKTSNISMYQNQEYYTDDNGVQKTRQGEWSVTNSIQVKLKEVAKADLLTDMLFSSGATNVYGPNFAIDETDDSKQELYVKALEDSKKKAEILAVGSGKKLGKVVSITMGNVAQVNPMYFSKSEGIGGGGGADLEQGTSSVNVSMTVVYELAN
jgi:uncharacterized protein